MFEHSLTNCGNSLWRARYCKDDWLRQVLHTYLFTKLVRQTHAYYKRVRRNVVTVANVSVRINRDLLVLKTKKHIKTFLARTDMQLLTMLAVCICIEFV